MHRVPCILAACCSLTTDVARSVVCVSVCWSHGWTAQKRLNRLRCRLGAQSCWLKEPWVGSRSRSFPREGAILAVVWPFEKHWESLPRCMYATEGIIQSSVTAWQRDCCSRLQCSRLVDVSVTLHCPREKSARATLPFIKILWPLAAFDFVVAWLLLRTIEPTWLWSYFLAAKTR